MAILEVFNGGGLEYGKRTVLEVFYIPAEALVGVKVLAHAAAVVENGDGGAVSPEISNFIFPSVLPALTGSANDIFYYIPVFIYIS